MEGADRMEIGTSLVLRGAAWQRSFSLACPPIQASVTPAACLPWLSVFLSFSTFLSFLQHVPCSILTFCLLPRSLSRYFSPYSVCLGTVTTAAADSPSTWVRSPPPLMTSLCWGAPGSHSFTDDPISLWNRKGQIPIYITVATETGERDCGREKMIPFIQENCVWWRVYWTHNRLTAEIPVTV